MPIDCSKCNGCCCHHVIPSLDRGDGVCKHLVNGKCSIYDHRPLICDTDRLYEVFYKNIMTKEEFIKLNLQACEKLRNESIKETIKEEESSHPRHED